MMTPDEFYEAKADELADELAAATELVTQLRGELAIMAAERECYRGGQELALQTVDKLAARLKAVGHPIGLDAYRR